MDAVAVIRVLTVLVFTGLAAVALLRWRRTHGAAAGWFGLSLAVLAAVTLSLAALPDGARSDAAEWLRKVTVATLALFPYLLYRFSAAFAAPGRRTEVVATGLTGAVVVLTLAVPAVHLVDDEGRPGWFALYLAVLIAQWLTLSLIVAVRFWRAGRGKPTVARRRMRTLSLGSLTLTLALVLAGGAEGGALVGIRLLALSGGCLLFLGFAPPARLRRAWRRSEEERARGAAATLVGATTVEQVTDNLLPRVNEILGGRGAALLDRDGLVLGRRGVTAEEAERAAAELPDAGEGGRVGLVVEEGALVVWTDPYTPFFGRDELELMRDLGSLAFLAAERCRLHELERAARIGLERQTELTGRLFDSTSDGILAFDRDIRYTLWTRGMERISGVTESEAIGRHAFEVFPFLEEIGEDRYFRDALSGRDAISTERRYTVPESGREGFFESHYSPLYGEGGEIVGGLAIVRDVTDRKRAEQEHAARAEAELRYLREHEIAETLQRSLLPERLPETPGMAVAGRYLPGGAGAVGGDWYDVLSLADGRLGLAMGDVVGHGIAAATAMGQLRSALRSYAVEGSPPGVVLDRLARAVRQLDEDSMATLLYIVFDPSTGSFRHCAAGHPPPLVMPPAGPPTYLRGASSLPLGVTGGRYADAEGSLSEGSLLVLYTDGLVERRGRSIGEGLAHLKRAVAQGPREPEALCDHLLASLLGDNVAEDDVALLVLQSVPVAGRPLRLRLPAEPRSLAPLRRLTERWLQGTGATREDVAAILVACGEAVTNAIEHAYLPARGHVDVAGDLEGDRVVVTIRDAGRWRAPRGEHRGRGLGLMNGLMDEADVTHGPDGTTVRLCRRLRTPAAV